MNKVALVTGKPDRLKDDALLSELEKHVGLDGIENSAQLSSQGKHLDLGRAATTPASIYTPVDASFKNAVLLKDECARLFANDLTVCWLAQLLLDMGRGSAVYMEMPVQQLRRHAYRVSLELLERKLPNLRYEVLDSQWLRLDWSGELVADKERLKTTYKYLHGAFNEFYEAWSGVFGSGEDSFKEAVRQFIYGIRGANAKGYVTGVVLHENYGDAHIHGLDLGGRAGFMAAELAVEGHDMMVLDIDAKYIELGAWIQEKCELSSRVELGVADAREIDRVEGQFGMIGLYETLPGVGKEYAPKIFRESMRLLSPGGVLIIQEGSFQAGRAHSDPWRERVFTLDELIRALTENAGEPVFYQKGVGRKLRREEILEDKAGIVAVVRKA